MNTKNKNDMKFYLRNIKTVDGDYELFVADNMCNTFLYAEHLLTNYNYIKKYLPEKQQRILDVGCGAGPFSIFYGKQKKDVTAIDLNPIALECCKRNIHKYNLEDRIRIKCENIKDFYEDEKFDIIVTNPPYGTSSYMRGNLSDERKKLYKKIEEGIFDSEVDDFLTNCWCDDDGRDMLDYIFDNKGKLLSDNGIVMIVCGDDFLDSEQYMINKAKKYDFRLVHSRCENKDICIVDGTEKFEDTRKFNILIFKSI